MKPERNVVVTKDQLLLVEALRSAVVDVVGAVLKRMELDDLIGEANHTQRCPQSPKLLSRQSHASFERDPCTESGARASYRGRPVNFKRHLSGTLGCSAWRHFWCRAWRQLNTLGLLWHIVYVHDTGGHQLQHEPLRVFSSSPPHILQPLCW